MARDEIADREALEKWGPYVSHRSWGTVREDYSADGNAWHAFPFSQAHMRVFRWGEDGIGAICDRYQTLVFSPAFWNGKDPILKERLFGLSSEEGNHGEDVKELYYPLDATPTHNYLKYLYKYPQQRFPYEKLVEENRARSTLQTEYEITDTGIFNEQRYFDIFITYAKVDPEDIVIEIRICNRADESACFHLLSQLTFRNLWAFESPRGAEPVLKKFNHEKVLAILAEDDARVKIKDLHSDYRLGSRYLYGPLGGEIFFTQNETNKQALFQVQNDTAYTKDAFHRKIIHNDTSALSDKGTKACIYYHFPKIDPKAEVSLYFRLSNKKLKAPFEGIDEVFAMRKEEADSFYEKIHPKRASSEIKNIQRQALAGMIWNKQVYLFDVHKWLEGDPSSPPPPEGHKKIRNIHWKHLNSQRVLSLPDKWEYPWFAAWDSAFHAVTLSLIDLDFAKQQLWLLLFDQFLHPNGQIPAYEWEFSDVNPPVQAWAALKLFEIEKKKQGAGDLIFLEKCFHKLLLNFSWWINKVDSRGNNVFEGGFLGLDNITIIDRSIKPSFNVVLDQADGAGWMAMFCLNLMKIALTLSQTNPVYQSLAVKFFEHFVYIAAAMRNGYGRDYDLFEEGFFYSVLHTQGEEKKRLKIRSFEGIIPLYATEVLFEADLKKFPEFFENFNWFIENRKDLTHTCVQRLSHQGEKVYLLSLLVKQEHEHVFKYIFDEQEFLSPYGMRSLSKYHESHPYTLYSSTIQYEPGESLERIKGGNSNWRGPIWFPTNYLLIETLKTLYKGYAHELKVGGRPLNALAKDLSKRLISLFLKGPDGNLPIYRDKPIFQQDPYFKDQLLFFEHFHGDLGIGLGASHQTGWTGLVANLIDEWEVDE